MKNFKIVPVTNDYATKIRESKIDDFGNHVYEQIASGKSPCHISLKPFTIAQDIRLVVAYSPFCIIKLIIVFILAD